VPQQAPWTLLDTPIKAPRATFIFFNEYEGSSTPQWIFAVPINALSFNPFGRRDDHESGAGRFAGCAHLNSFFVMRNF